MSASVSSPFAMALMSQRSAAPMPDAFGTARSVRPDHATSFVAQTPGGPVRVTRLPGRKPITTPIRGGTR